MPVCGTPVPPGGKLDLWAPSLRSDGHCEPAWCRSLLSPSALLRPLVVNITLQTPTPVQPSETAGFVTRRLGGEAPSSREPAYPRGREPCAGRAANWAGAKAPRGAGARPGAFHLFKANGSRISQQVFRSLFVQRNGKKETRSLCSQELLLNKKSTPNFFSGGRLLCRCDKTVTSGEESTRA